MWGRTPNVETFQHNNEEITGTLTSYHGEAYEDKGYSFSFDYKNTKVNLYFKEQSDWWHLAPLHCEIINNFGSETYEKYSNYLSDVSEIKSNYIIVDGNVYNYYSKLAIHSPKYFVVSLELENGEILDGTNALTETKDHESKKGLFEMLQTQALNAYKFDGIKPAEKQLNLEKTKELQEKQKWIDDIHKSLKM